jgi:hypothetical protein
MVTFQPACSATNIYTVEMPIVFILVVSSDGKPAAGAAGSQPLNANDSTAYACAEEHGMMKPRRKLMFEKQATLTCWSIPKSGERVLYWIGLNAQRLVSKVLI